MLVKVKDWLAVLTCALCLLAATLAASAYSTALAVCTGFALSAAVLLLATMEVYRRLRAYADSRVWNSLRQAESLFYLFFRLRPDQPFPPCDAGAASPDLLREITQLVLDEKPELVLEAGSGVSTLFVAYALRSAGQGRVMSLEHSPEYADLSEKLLASHGLKDYATVVRAPLKRTGIAGRDWLWYDLGALKLDQPVDLFIVDGPPAPVQRLARYPALPLLHGRLREGAAIILDDGCREDEKEIVAMWCREFPGLQCRFLPLEKGAFLLRAPRAGHPAQPSSG
ncbi:MAG: class I SAM-dependent methyltransferase [Planctomycetes bacterium]|nr:class I SAM-dependent methyltransferase [Planctomycetota bacterium]